MGEQTFLVRDYMNPKPKTIHKSATFRDAINTMILQSTNGLVVVDDNNHVAGILSSWDLIERLVPDYLEEDLHLAMFESGSIFRTRIEEVAHDPIAEIMTGHVHSITAEKNLMNAATLLSEFKIRQLPVVDDEGVLIGYLNRTDIKRAIGEILGQSNA